MVLVRARFFLLHILFNKDDFYPSVESIHAEKEIYHKIRNDFALLPYPKYLSADLEDLQKQYGYRDFDEIFEKAYFSYILHLRKPDPAIFLRVLNENRLVPAETLFIDDTLISIEAARKIGINGYHLKKGEDVTRLFL